jgi:hypothetical protein
MHKVAVLIGSLRKDSAIARIGGVDKLQAFARWIANNAKS